MELNNQDLIEPLSLSFAHNGAALPFPLDQTLAQSRHHGNLFLVSKQQQAA